MSHKLLVTWLKSTWGTGYCQLLLSRVLQLMGVVTLGWMWLKMVQVSGPLAANGSAERDFHEAKLITASFFAQRELPLAAGYRKQVEAGAETLMKLPEEAF